MRIFLTAVFLAAAGAAMAGSQASGEGAQPAASAAVFAKVGATVISADEFRASVLAGMRQRFYHGQVPPARVASFAREVGTALIDHALLLQEARRRGLQPDAAVVQQRLAAIEARFAKDPRWGESARAAARSELEEDSLIEQLQARVRAVATPSGEEVRRYYDSHPEKFTTPERLRVSLILLSVQPWAPGAAWQAAVEEALRLLKQLRDGGDFAELARLHSADDSAQRGGDLGYIHLGMLAPEAQQVLDAMKPGELSEPVRLLKGIAIFRLEERQAPVLNDFARSAARAQGLLLRERQDQAWRDLLSGLRAGTSIEVNEAVYSMTD